jgi:choline transport protein
MSEKEKSTPTISVQEISVGLAHTASNDQKDMMRMGKKQEFVRNFRIFTSIAFTSCVMGTWELLITTSLPALVAGGTAGLFWSTIWGYFGQSFIVLSLAEMASMAPTAGGQYHWVRSLLIQQVQG